MKAPPTRPAGFLNPFEPHSRPFQQIGMTLLGPFPKSKRIIVATDYLTRYAEINRLTERLNKTIADMPAMYADAEHKTWVVILTYVVFAYNAAVQEETTQMTPFRLVYGSEGTTTL
ncbi:uncharacterized protein LOC144115035 [Amblyomma americanum]